MKREHVGELRRRMDDFLGWCDTNGNNPEWCYEDLALDMAKAAQAVYDACMAGQKYMRHEQRG